MEIKMMNSKVFVGFLILFFLTLAMANASAECWVEGHLTGEGYEDEGQWAKDIQMEILPGFAKLFVAEGRSGCTNTFELDIGADTGAPADTAQYTWPKDVKVPFKLEYDGSTANFTVTNTEVSYSVEGTFTDIFLRTRASEDETSILVNDLKLNGNELGGNSHAVGPATNDWDTTSIDILWIRCDEEQNALTLSGNSTMNWTGSKPTQSKLAYQIKVVSTEEPSKVPILSSTGTAVLMGVLAGAGAIALRRKDLL